MHSSVSLQIQKIRIARVLKNLAQFRLNPDVTSLQKMNLMIEQIHVNRITEIIQPM